MMIGIPGSGKSTFAKLLAKKNGYAIISTDSVRLLNPFWEEPLIWPEVYRRCAEAIANCEDAIFDATNVTPKVRKRFVDEVQKHGVKVEMIAYYFDTPWEVCYERVVKRNQEPNVHHIPADIVQGYGERIIFPTFEEGFSTIYRIVDSEIVEEKNNV